MISYTTQQTQICPDCHGNGYVRLKFEAEESGDAYLCMCKHSKNAPYCDGTHAKLKEENNTA